MIDPALIRARFACLSPHLDEHGRRLLAASEAQAAGHGGIVAVSRATGLAPSTIGRGLRELADGAPLPAGWVRRAGGGGPLTVRSICPGSVAHWPRHNLRPVSSTTHSAGSFCDTSIPTNRAIEPPPMCEPLGNSAQIAASCRTYAPAAITRCPHMGQARLAGRGLGSGR